MADYDVLIIGGGMVGASLACALGGRRLTVGLVDSHPLQADHHPGYDERTLALSLGTRRIFDSLGLWPELAGEATPIRQIHVSDRGRPGIARLDCRDEGVEALGYVIPARAIGTVLAHSLERLAGVEMLMPATLEGVDIQAPAARAMIRTGAGENVQVQARLLVAADGARSRVREQLGIDTLHWDYGQSAVIANVTPQYPHRNVAYERFTSAGPVALLPLSGDRCAVVCTVAGERVEEVMGLDDAAFAGLLTDRFGDRLGEFERVGSRQVYPLHLLKSREHVRSRVAVIGNAAHTLHPIAGQGFNLGIRDVAALAEVVVDARREGRDFGGETVLARYGDWRRWDQRRTIAFTDGLTRLFGNPLGPVAAARNLGLLAFDLLPPAKRWLARQAMGLDGRLPRLARGLPL